MGTRTIISGLSPEIALTLQTMGVELQSMQTALTVEQALEMLGLRVVRPGQKKASASAAATAQDDGFRDRSDISFEGGMTGEARSSFDMNRSTDEGVRSSAGGVTTFESTRSRRR
jgi:rsbT antagonist protein RsbS